MHVCPFGRGNAADIGVDGNLQDPEWCWEVLGNAHVEYDFKTLKVESMGLVQQMSYSKLFIF